MIQEINWPQFFINNLGVIATIIGSAFGIVWRTGVKLKKTAEEVIGDNQTVKTGMLLMQADMKVIQADSKAIQLKVDHLEKNIVQQQNNLIQSILTRLDSAEKTLELLRKELRTEELREHK